MNAPAWAIPDTIAICSHVQQHGPTDWQTVATAIDKPPILCALKWHVLYLAKQQDSQFCRRAQLYTDWELGVLLKGCEGIESSANHSPYYRALAQWMPGRTCLGIKQAVRKYVISAKYKTLARLPKLPGTLTAVLEAWPGPGESATDLRMLPARYIAAKLLADLTGHPSTPKTPIGFGISPFITTPHSSATPTATTASNSSEQLLSSPSTDLGNKSGTPMSKHPHNVSAASLSGGFSSFDVYEFMEGVLQSDISLTLGCYSCTPAANQLAGLQQGSAGHVPSLKGLPGMPTGINNSFQVQVAALPGLGGVSKSSSTEEKQRHKLHERIALLKRKAVPVTAWMVSATAAAEAAEPDQPPAKWPRHGSGEAGSNITKQQMQQQQQQSVQRSQLLQQCEKLKLQLLAPHQAAVANNQDGALGSSWGGTKSAGAIGMTPFGGVPAAANSSRSVQIAGLSAGLQAMAGGLRAPWQLGAHQQQQSEQQSVQQSVQTLQQTVATSPAAVDTIFQSFLAAVASPQFSGTAEQIMEFPAVAYSSTGSQALTQHHSTSHHVADSGDTVGGSFNDWVAAAAAAYGDAALPQPSDDLKLLDLLLANSLGHCEQLQPATADLASGECHHLSAAEAGCDCLSTDWTSAEFAAAVDELLEQGAEPSYQQEQQHVQQHVQQHSVERAVCQGVVEQLQVERYEGLDYLSLAPMNSFDALMDIASWLG